MKLGATGKFPDGKKSEHDEGELRFAVGHDATNVVLDFGTPVAWMALPFASAVELAKAIAFHAGAKKIEIEL